MTIVMDTSEIPWGKYLGQSTLEIGFAAGANVLTKSTESIIIKSFGSKVATSSASKGVIGKAVGAKVGSMAGSKVLSGTITLAVDVVTLGAGIAVDWLFNEGYEALNRESDRIVFATVVENIIEHSYIPKYTSYRTVLLSKIKQQVLLELDKKATLTIIEKH
jgi:hypothetical protein